MPARAASVGPTESGPETGQMPGAVSPEPRMPAAGDGRGDTDSGDASHRGGLLVPGVVHYEVIGVTER